MHQENLEPGRVFAEAARRGFQPGDVTVVVRAENIHGALEAALQLVQEIGDVRSEVGRAAVLTDDDAVLFIPQTGGAKPGGAIVFVQVAVFTQTFYSVLNGAAFFQFPLGEPLVESDAEFGQVVFDIRQNVVQRGVEKHQVAFFAQQIIRALDQCVQVQFAVASLRHRGGQAFVHVHVAEAPLVAVIDAHFPGDFGHCH